MMMINKHIDKLNQSLYTLLDDRSPLGLAHGKIGVCIYLFHLSKITQSKTHKNLANDILDNIFSTIHQHMRIEVKDGLAGIGLGVNYLIDKGFRKGDINTILQDIDNVIYRQLSYENHIESYDLEDLIHLLFYLLVRLKKQKKKTESECLFKDLIIETLNYIYGKIDVDFFIEPPHYDIGYLFPQFLYILSEIYSMDFYNERVKQILEEISSIALTIFPSVHANRLYLLWGIDSVLKAIKVDGWREYQTILRQNINVNYILNQELGTKNIYFNCGYSSLYLLIESFNENAHSYKEAIIKKIEQSKEWDVLIKNPAYLATHKGLFNGFCGVVLIYLLHKKGI